MIMSLYAAIGFVAILLVLMSRSHRVMNALSALHAASYIVLSFYIMLYSELPKYYLENRYLFIDHLSVYEVLITALLFLLSAIYSKGYVEGSIRMRELSPGNLKLFYAMFNLLLISMTYSFFSNNLALFWIFAELITIFSALLIVTLNAKKNIGAALKYVFITSSAMLFSFIGLIFLFTLTERTLGTGTLNWDLLMIYANQLSPRILFASFALIFIGFAAKSGIVPFHGWLPTAHSKAPAPISVILSGSVTSVGIYGILRIYAIMGQTSALPKISLLLIAFGVFSIFIAAFSMLSQFNLKKLIGYSTVENMGFMLVGIGIGAPVAIFWVLFHVLAHAITKALLFFSAGIIHHQYEGVRIEHIKDILRLQSFASFGLIVGSAAIMGMPPFAIFLPKIFILLQAGKVSTALIFVLLILLAIASASFAIFLMRIFSQIEEQKSRDDVKPYVVPAGMKIPIIVLIAFIFVLGVVFPQQLSDLLMSIIKELRLS